MKSKNTNGFTLVELIIVITILAILATIAFISFQSYTKDARNSKRDSDLNSIARAMEVKLAEGVSIMNFASGSGNTIASIKLAGSGTFKDETKYKAGDINTLIVGATNTDSFLDPKAKVGYKIGVTTLAGGAYELASIREVDNGVQAIVLGTFKSRNGETATGTVSGNKITLTEGQGLFKKGDILENADNNTGTVLSVSPDLSVLTLEDGYSITNTATATGFQLTGGTETAGLIAKKGDNSTAVVNGSGSTLPY